jgi:hypothetical protein
MASPLALLTQSLAKNSKAGRFSSISRQAAFFQTTFSAQAQRALWGVLGVAGLQYNFSRMLLLPLDRRWYGVSALEQSKHRRRSAKEE